MGEYDVDMMCNAMFAVLGQAVGSTTNIQAQSRASKHAKLGKLRKKLLSQTPPPPHPGLGIFWADSSAH
jgi:hypothetical protein